MYYTSFITDLCDMIIAGNEEGICALHLVTTETKRSFFVPSNWILSPDKFKTEIQQILEYLEGKRKVFDIKINPKGTPFQKKVWNELMNIPYSHVTNYKSIAKNIDNPNASRAVGNANSKNPIPIIIPCHRVVSSDNSLCGYAFGTDIKQTLLDLELKNK